MTADGHHDWHSHTGVHVKGTRGKEQEVKRLAIPSALLLLLSATHTEGRSENGTVMDGTVLLGN